MDARRSFCRSLKAGPPDVLDINRFAQAITTPIFYAEDLAVIGTAIHHKISLEGSSNFRPKPCARELFRIHLFR